MSGKQGQTEAQRLTALANLPEQDKLAIQRAADNQFIEQTVSWDPNIPTHRTQYGTLEIPNPNPTADTNIYVRVQMPDGSTNDIPLASRDVIKSSSGCEYLITKAFGIPPALILYSNKNNGLNGYFTLCGGIDNMKRMEYNPSTPKNTLEMVNG